MVEKEKTLNKLNIAMVCDPITDYTAGSFISTLRFSELLKERGHKIIFIAARSPKNPEDNYHKDIKVYRFPSLLLPKSEKSVYISFPSPKKIKKILKEEEIDIVHILLPTPAGIVAAKAAKSLGIKIVVHSHTQPENLFLHLPKSMKFILEPLNRIFYTYLSWFYGQANTLVYPSEFAKKCLNKPDAGIDSVVISNGVNINKFKKINADEFFDKFNLSRETKNVLFVGRLHPEKRVDTLIKSVSYIANHQPNIHVFIVGAGHQDKELRQLAGDLGLAEYITFLGKVSDEDLIMAYNACDVFVLPSLAELEGMVVLEAMACGKPIVIADSKDSASPHFVDQNGLLFEPENHQDLAEKVVTILADENMRSKMGEISFKKSRQYDINESVSKLENLYYSLLNK